MDKPAAVTTSLSANFTFTATPSAGSTFQCKVDVGEFVSCVTPYNITVTEGTHTLLVRAVNGGNVDPTPASHTWKVDAIASDNDH